MKIFVDIKQRTDTYVSGAGDERERWRTGERRGKGTVMHFKKHLKCHLLQGQWAAGGLKKTLTKSF